MTETENCVTPELSVGTAVTATGDGASLTRSEERLIVITERVPARRMRLEKFVVTETRTVTVEVSHEEFRLVEVDVDQLGTGGTDSTEAPDPTRWLVLSEQRIAITTESVPVERVRLEVTTVIEDRDVTATVRREQIELDQD